MRFTLCLLAALMASFAARAEVLSLRCTVTRDGEKPYAGYVWIDMPTRRALEQWFPGGQRGPIDGPFPVLIYPNDLQITDQVKLHIDRTKGTGVVSGGKVACYPSDVKSPPFPALPKTNPTPAAQPKTVPPKKP
jgi:hypothetical protein